MATCSGSPFRHDLYIKAKTRHASCKLKNDDDSTVNRLANGNTVITCWVAGDDDTSHWRGSVQVLEVAPAKKIVWALSFWKYPDLGPATSIQLLDQHGNPEDLESGR